MESTPKRQGDACRIVRKEDIKQFDPLATPSPKKSGIAKDARCAIRPLFQTRARAPFHEMDGNRIELSVSKVTPPSRVGRFCIRHSLKHEENAQHGIEINITVEPETAATQRNGDIIDLLF